MTTGATFSTLAVVAALVPIGTPAPMTHLRLYPWCRALGFNRTRGGS